jgi:hypothetical protein
VQLDQTHVAIRPRKLSEIGDLAIMLLRQYPQAILVGFTVGAAPWMIINALVLGWMPLAETAETLFDEETVLERQRYVWLMAVLIFLETPLAGIFTTSYIGQAVFQRRPTWMQVWRDTLRMTPRLLLTLGVIRGPLIAVLLLLFIRNEPFMPGIEVGWILVIVGLAAFLRSVRPFLPEILLLERCPLFPRHSDTIGVRRRSSLLHGPISGDLMGRFILAGVMIVLLSISLFYGYTFIVRTLLNSDSWSLLVSMVLFPLALWTAGSFSVLLRFLSYLDSRIRLEGWEVELVLRAEAQRQFGDPDMLISESMRSARHTTVGGPIS